MKIVELRQGTPAWHAHRASHLNASDAPAMLGLSPYKTRAALVREKATGVAAEIDAPTQRRFDDGHRFEAMARPVAESIIGDELFPCVGADGKYSASFDGLAMAFDVAFEHKSLNEDLRVAFAAMDGAPRADGVLDARLLPEHYRVQMEHQCMVSGAERVLFMASCWDGEELRESLYCWYVPETDLRARIVAGWEQFEADVVAYVPDATSAPPATGARPDSLPSLRIAATGMITESNLAAWRDVALGAIRSANRDLQTDEDFADAEQTVKWCADVEARVDQAKAAVLAQTTSIDDALRQLDDVREEARRVRLDLDKLVKARKESIKGEIVTAGRDAVVQHYAGINATLGAHAVPVPASIGMDLAAAIKGLRTLSSLRNAVDTAVANMKIAASQRADQVRAAVAAFEAEVGAFGSLFPDVVTLCGTKAPEDLRNLMVARIGDHQKKLEADRERIRAEEVAKLAPPPAEAAAPEPARTVTTIRRAPVAAPKPARPSDAEIVSVLALHFRVHESAVVGWLCEMVLSELEVLP